MPRERESERDQKEASVATKGRCGFEHNSDLGHAKRERERERERERLEGGIGNDNVEMWFQTQF